MTPRFRKLFSQDLEAPSGIIKARESALSKPFDATTKQIIDSDPLALVRFLGLPGATATVVDSDLAMTAQADRLIAVTDPPYILHGEMQASYKVDLPDRIHFYHMAARRKFGQSVRSVVFLLRKEADGPAMSGIQTDASFEFRFEVVRVWEIDPERLLTGPVSLLPLAAISRVTEQSIPGVIRRMQGRVDTESVDVRAFWSTTLILLGLNYPAEFARVLLAGVTNMQESSTYQSILAEGLEQGLEKGRAEGERQLLIVVGRKRLGEPDAASLAALNAITSIETFEALASRLLEVESWQDLLNG